MYITFSEEDCGESFDEVIRCMYRDICVIMTYRHYNSRTGYVADGSVERKDLGYCFSVYLVFVMIGFYFDVTGLANGFWFSLVFSFMWSVLGFCYFFFFLFCCYLFFDQNIAEMFYFLPLFHFFSLVFFL